MKLLTSRLRVLGTLWCACLMLAQPPRALGQSSIPALPALSQDVRDNVLRAAGESSLPPWQRQLMRRIAGAADTAFPAPAVPARGGAQPGSSSSIATDGFWSEIVPAGMMSSSAFYDSARQRLLVVGGDDGASGSTVPGVWAFALAGSPVWSQVSTTGAPSNRRGQAAVYDRVHDRIVMFGGGQDNDVYLNDCWALSLSGTPVWTQLNPKGTPPGFRGFASAIYDSTRNRMVVFGGYAGSGVFNDVWSLSFADTSWALLATAGTPPAARAACGTILDRANDRLVVFGGFGSSVLSDTWALSFSGTPAWTQLTPTGTPPAARYGDGAVYDPVRSRMVVFGGTPGGAAAYSDTWALSLAGSPGWTQLTPTGTPPAARAFAAAAYDPVRDQMLAFGGGDMDTVTYSNFNDVWSLPLAGSRAWQALTPTGLWLSGIEDAACVLDPVRNRILAFGGIDGGGSTYFNDVWALSLYGTPAWTLLAPLGTRPSARSCAGAVYDPAQDRMVVFGGRNGSTYSNDAWALSLSGTPTWTAMAPAGSPPAARQGHGTIYDSARGRMVVFGGWNGSGALNDAWALTLAAGGTWTALVPTGTPPAARSNPGAIYDPVGDRMVLFGGQTLFGDCLGDTWALTLSGTPVWNQLALSGLAPTPRVFHSVVYDPVRRRMVLFGGRDASYNYFNDALALSLTGTPAWTALAPTGVLPDLRGHHGAVYQPARDRMLVCLGGNHTHSPRAVCALGWSTTADVGPAIGSPFVSGLRSPAPNPFRAGTAVSFTVARPGRVRLGVYDVGGRLVRTLVDGQRSAGDAMVLWDGTDDAGARREAGLYFVRLSGPESHDTRKVILIP